MHKVPEIHQKLLNDFFNANIVPKVRFDYPIGVPEGFSVTEIESIDHILKNRSCVLGIDIYHYSQFSEEKRTFVPFVFEEVFLQAINLIEQNFMFLFQGYDLKAFRNLYIPTGDGGFLVLETPLHAIVFAITLEMVFRMYNSFRFTRKLRGKVGEITVRYAISYDNVYSLHDKLYGSAIITCARLLRRDRLNRLLIDSHSFSWFTEMMMGIENLQTISIEELLRMPSFANYKKPTSGENNALIPEKLFLNQFEGVKTVNVQKIGAIKEKDTLLEVYNVHLQAVVEYVIFSGTKIWFTLSLGNSNASGIQD